MPGFTAIGVNSKTIFLLENEDALYLEFTVNADVKKGQPVKLTAAGQITPAASDDYPSLIIGYALFDAVATTLCTVITRGVAMIYGLCNAATQNCNLPVTYKGYDTTHNTATNEQSGTLGFNLYGVATTEAAGVVTTGHGWQLDAGVAQYDLVRILLRN